MSSRIMLRVNGDSVFKFARKGRIKTFSATDNGAGGEAMLFAGADTANIPAMPASQVLSGAVPVFCIADVTLAASTGFTKQEVDYPIDENTVLCVSSGGVTCQIGIEIP